MAFEDDVRAIEEEISELDKERMYLARFAGMPDHRASRIVGILKRIRGCKRTLYLEKNADYSTKELADIFKVSPSTIRRDLEWLRHDHIVSDKRFTGHGDITSDSLLDNYYKIKSILPNNDIYS